MKNPIVRKNLISQKEHTPYCGSYKCRRMPRTKFNGDQFKCPDCGWASEFPENFINQYRERQGL